MLVKYVSEGDPCPICALEKPKAVPRLRLGVGWMKGQGLVVFCSAKRRLHWRPAADEEVNEWESLQMKYRIKRLRFLINQSRMEIRVLTGRLNNLAHLAAESQFIQQAD